jgi:hypothetical protein
MLIFLIFFTETTEPNEFKFGLDMPWVVPYPTAPLSSSCVLFVFILCLVCPMLPVSLDCPFLIVSLGFSRVYFKPYLFKLKQQSSAQMQLISRTFSFFDFFNILYWNHWTKWIQIWPGYALGGSLSHSPIIYSRRLSSLKIEKRRMFWKSTAFVHLIVCLHPVFCLSSSCVLFVFILCLVCPMLPVSLDCPFCATSSVFSIVYWL